MSSKMPVIKTCLSVAAVFSFLGCVPKVGEAPPASPTREFKQTACLNQSSSVIRNFIEAKASDEEITQSWACLGGAFEAFSRYVRGQSRDAYTPQELATFFEDNFFGQNARGTLSPDLLRELMKIKQVFIGGRQDLLTREEIKKTVQIIENLQKLTLILNPHMKVILQKWSPRSGDSFEEEDLKKFEAANTALQFVAKDLGSIFESNQSSYKVMDFVRFFRELANFYHEQWAWIDAFEKYIPVLQKLKKAVSGGDEDLILPQQWPTVLILSGRSYFQYLRYSYFVSPRQLNDRSVKLNFFARTLEDTFSAFEDLVQKKPSGQVSREEMDEILFAISKVWPELKTSEKLSFEFMKIKRVFFGGSTDAWAKQDFATARLKMSEVRTYISQIVPFLSIYSLDWDSSNQSADEVEKTVGVASAVLARMMRAFGADLKSDYDSNDLLELVHEWRRLYPKVERAKQSNLQIPIEKYLPVAQAWRNVLYEKTGTVIGQNEWESLLGSVFDGFGLYLNYYYNIEKRNLSEAEAQPIWDRLLMKASDFGAQILQQKPHPQLSSDEIAAMLNGLANIDPEIPVSVAGARGLLELKAFIFGGDAQVLTAGEIRAGGQKLPLLSQIIRRLKPYSDVYSLQAVNLQSDRFTEAMSAFGEALTHIAGLPQGEYNLQHLTDFLRDWAPRSTLNEKVPFLNYLKKMYFADNSSVVNANQWKKFVPLVGKGYSSFLEYHYFLSEGGIDRLETVTRWQGWTPSTMAMLKDFIATKADGAMTPSQVMELLEQAQKVGMISKEIELDTYEPVIGVVLGRILAVPVERLMGEAPRTLNVKTLQVIQNEVSGFFLVQKFLIELFAEKEGRLSGAKVRKAISEKLAEGGLSPSDELALTELRDVLKSPVPMVVDKKGRWLLSPRYNLEYDFPSLQIHNWLRIMSRLMVSSYAAEMERIRTGAGIYLSEAERAFREFRPVAINLGLIAPGDQTFMTSRFREANIFMPRADGNQIASRMEIHELIFSIMSGLKINKMLQKDLRQACIKGKRLRVFKQEYVDYDCMSSVYTQAIPRYMTATPELIRFQKGVPAAVFQKFFRYSLIGVGWVPRQDGMVPIEDVSLLPHLLQYIELLYVRFDSDADMGIRVPEAIVAFPAFQALFRELAKSDLESGRLKQSDLLALFTYVLRYGKPPAGIWDGLTKWYPWKDNPQSWAHYADRPQIAQILAFIAEQLATPRSVVGNE